MRHVVIFAGNFNIFSKIHLEIAKIAKQDLSANEIWFLPFSFSVVKDKFLFPLEQRVNLVKEGVKTRKDFQVFEYCEEKGIYPTFYHLLRNLTEQENDNFYTILMGSDKWNYFEYEHNASWILNRFKIAVYQRKNNWFEKKSIFNNIKPIYFNEKLLPSTSTSKLIYDVKTELIEDSILDLIEENGYFAENRLRQVMDEEKITDSITTARIAAQIAKTFFPNLSKKAFVAGIYADFAKYLKSKHIKKIIEKNGIFTNENKILSTVSAFLLQKKQYIRNGMIIDAITNYPEATKSSNELTKIIHMVKKNKSKLLEMDVKNLSSVFNNF